MREMIEQFKKICMEKITSKRLDPAEFKQGVYTHSNSIVIVDNIMIAIANVIRFQ